MCRNNLYVWVIIKTKLWLGLKIAILIWIIILNCAIKSKYDLIHSAFMLFRICNYDRNYVHSKAIETLKLVLKPSHDLSLYKITPLTSI